MASIKDVKEKAAQYVNKGKYDKAIQLYTKIIEKLQEKGNPDIALYNRVGDIYLDKLSNKELAVENYRTAMTMYGKFGLYPNAIAMAKKVLKIDSSLIEMYEKIAEFNKQQGLIGEALNNYILYAEKSIQNNDRKSAIKAFKETLDMMPEKVEIKEKLVDLYIQEEQFDQAVELLKEVEAHFIKMNSLEQAAVIRQKITRYAKHTSQPEPEIKPQQQVQPPKQADVSAQQEDIELGDFDMSDLVDDLTKELDSSFDQAAAEAPEETTEPVQPSNPFEQPAEDIGLSGADMESIGEINYEDFVELAKLQEEFDISEAVGSYYQGAEGYASTNDTDNAMRVYSRIVEIKPDEMKAHKAIMDIANKTNNHVQAIQSYIYIAKQSMSANPKETLMLLNKVLAVEPGNAEANQLKAQLAPPKPQPQPQPQTQEHPQVQQAAPEPASMSADDFLSEFKSEITEDIEGNDLLTESEHVTAQDIMKGNNEGHRPKFKVENEEPPAGGDDVWSLNELLDELKEGVNESIPEDDVSSHYDLGVSFKEMALYDMAIEELNKSIKNKDYELRSMEMLGQCYLEKGETDKAENLLIKALSSKNHKPEEYLGIKRTLAVLYEQKKMFSQAKKLLNEIKQTDPSFKDIDKHLDVLNNAMKAEEQPKKQSGGDDSLIDFSELLKDESSEDALGDFDDIDIDLDDEDEGNKSKKISYM